jgi:hypothetical protein
MVKIYFISGHRDITVKDFFKHYQKPIDDAMNEGSSFVVGDCMGVDLMAQVYIASKLQPPWMMTIYHMCTTPRYYQDGFPVIGGHISDVHRDFTMTLNSDVDIAWIAPGRERSGTQQNIDRRIWMNDRKEKGLTYTLTDIQSREANLFL